VKYKEKISPELCALEANIAALEALAALIVQLKLKYARRYYFLLPAKTTAVLFSASSLCKRDNSCIAALDLMKLCVNGVSYFDDF